MELNQGWTHNAMLLLLHTILPAMFQTCIQTLKFKALQSAIHLTCVQPSNSLKRGQVAEHKPQVLLIKKELKSSKCDHYTFTLLLTESCTDILCSTSNVQIIKSYVIS